MAPVYSEENVADGVDPSAGGDAGTRLRVGAADAGRRVDEVLAERLGIGRRGVARLLDAVRVGGRRVRKGDRLAAGDEILVAPDVAASPVDPPSPEPAIVREEERVVLLDKPSGLPTVALAGRRAPSVAGWVARRYPPCAEVGRPGECGIAHRLDTATSGLLLVARDEASWRDLRGQFDMHTVRKEYLAVVEGAVPAEGFTIDVPIGQHPHSRRRVRAVSDPATALRYGARPAATRVELVERLAGASLVRATATTGARHQVRVHLAALGHPLVADEIYGGRVRPPVASLLLHAAGLRWQDPEDGAPREATSPLPDHWSTALDALRAGG